MWTNNLVGYCSNFPGPGAKLCIPQRCEVYTVQLLDRCYGIVAKYKKAFTVKELTSWNPNIRYDCINLYTMVGYEICVSSPGEWQFKPTLTSTATTTQE
jgi:hypothetical protein